jgi:hypothetical protein
MMHHQVLQRILVALLLLKAEEFDLIQVDQPFGHWSPMVLEQYNLGFLNQLFLPFLQDISIINRLLLID